MAKYFSLLRGVLQADGVSVSYTVKRIIGRIIASADLNKKGGRGHEKLEKVLAVWMGQ